MKKLLQNNILEDFDKNNGIFTNGTLDIIKNKIKSCRIKAINSNLFFIINPKFKSHVHETKNKIFSINNFIKLGLVSNKNQLHDIFIQNLIQRVAKNRRNAIKNNKYQDPFKKNDIIKNTGLLIAQRYIKNHWNINSFQNHKFNKRYN